MLNVKLVCTSGLTEKLIILPIVNISILKIRITGEVSPQKQIMIEILNKETDLK